MRCSSTDKPSVYIAIGLIAAVAAYAVEPSNGDIAMVTAAAQANLAEVELGKLAIERGNSQAVRSFAAKMVADHGTSNTQLAAIAEHEKIPLPMNPDVSHVELGKDLANRQGTDFDRRYVQAMQEDQRREVDLLKASRVSVSDERLKAFIRDALPVAEEHSRMADRLTIE